MKTSTVVTAYYQLKHKYTLQAPCSAVAYDPKNPYVAWIKNLFKLQANIIFYTDKATYDNILQKIIEESGKTNLSVQFVERSDFYANKHLGIDWAAQHQIDRERKLHTPDVYDIWTQKVDFVRRAMELADFSHTWYTWVDAGCFRGFNDYEYVYKTFPSTRRMVPGKITINLITQLRPEELALRKYHTQGGFVPNLRRDVAAATCLGGDRTAWVTFHDVYYTMLKRYYDHGFFVGREETLYTKCLIIYPELFHTYKNTSSTMGEAFSHFVAIHHWFFFKLYLSDACDFPDACQGTGDTPA